jgi:hypothetical protein
VTGPGAGTAQVSRSLSAAEIATAATFLALVGAVLFRPWDRAPFPVQDFGGLLTMLQSAKNPVDAFATLLAELGSEGRVTPLSMAYVTANWALFGADPLGWQLLRACVMVAVATAGYALLRLVGARRGAAFAGALLFVIADPARTVWQMPQAFEHVASLLTIAAALTTLRYRDSVRWRTRAVVIAILLVLAIWVREPMIAAVPFIVVLALMYRGPNPPTLPRLDRRALFLAGVLAVAVILLTLVPILVVRSAVQQAGGYASRFGLENVSPANAANVAAALVLPVTREPLFPANILFVVAVAAAAMGTGNDASRYRTLLVIAALLPLAAAAIYVMWPSFPSNYALPYLVAVALVFALALTRLWEGSLVRRALAVATSCVVVGYGALLASNERRQYVAALRLDADMAAAVSEAAHQTRLLAAVDDPVRSGHYAEGLRLYAIATVGSAPDSATDLTCADALQVIRGRAAGVLVVRPPHTCVSWPLEGNARLLQREARIRNWKTLRAERWQVSAVAWSASRASSEAAAR